MSLDWDAAVRHLDEGGVIAHPTETVYGLAAPVDATGVARLRSMKGRREDQPFLILVSAGTAGRDWLSRLDWTAQARSLAARFWPGPVTLVLSDPERRVPEGAANATGGVALRVSPHPLTEALLERWGAPLLSTSANRSGSPPARSAADVRRSFHDEIAEGALMLLDGGSLETSPPSTVVDCTGGTIRILREGAVPASAVTSRPEDARGQ